MKKETIKKIGAGVLAGLVVGIGGMALLAPSPEPVTITEYLQGETVIIEKEVPFEVEVEKIVEVPVEVEKLVEVMIEDETFKVMACDRLLYDDLNDCVFEVSAEDAALKLALEYLEAEFEGDIADEMEDEGIVNDEDDVELVKIYDDFEDVEILKSDYDDEEYKFKFKVKYEDDDKKKYVNVTIEVEDGEADLKKVVEA